MTRALFPLAYLAVAALAGAQAQASPDPSRELFGVRVRLAYGFSSGFDKDTGTAHLQGPEIAVALPVGRFLGREVLLEPSFFGGGRLRHGNDDDADIYRLTAFLHRTFAQDVDARVGIGFASATRARGGGFDGKSGLVADFGVSIPFTVKRFGQYATYADVHAILSSEDMLSGYFIGIGAKL